MKKKGFTLIELIAAIAILSITIAAISTAFITGIKTWKNGDEKLNTMCYAQGISEAFKGSTIAKITQLGNDSGSSFFAYFDEGYKNFTLYTSSGSNSLTNPGTPANFTDWFNYGPKIQGKVSNDDFSNRDTSVFNNCYNNNTSKRRYGSYIMIEKDARESTIGTVYYIKVRVWDLNYGVSSESTREVYIGG